MTDTYAVMMHFINQLATPQSYTASFVRDRYNATWHPHADFYTVEYPAFTVRLEHSNYRRDNVRWARWAVFVYPPWSSACAEAWVYPDGSVVIVAGTRDIIVKVIDYCLNNQHWGWWKTVKFMLSRGLK